MLKRICKAVSVAFLIICLVVAMLPSLALADPVSATIMANAFAQAIAAYGASNGVAMTFDVSNTNGIGESVHELWKDFRAGTQDADDYATLAAALFPELYYKSAVALGTASDAVAVGVHISDTYAEEFDKFYNWLLSGPAEMVQVDNSFYEFASSQIGPNSVPLSVYSSSVVGIGDVPFYDPSTVFCAIGYLYRGYISNTGPGSYCYVIASENDPSTPWIVVLNTTNTTPRFDSISFSWLESWTSGNTTYYAYQYNNGSVTLNVPITIVPAVYNFYKPSVLFGNQDIGSITDDIGVSAYDATGIADFPDTSDPNYDALGRAKDIPLDIPWDDSLYGDGTGTLTDAQSQAIAEDLTDALATDKTVELVEEGNPPAPPPGEVYIPFLPVDLPSFNFSFSGIWHYVREWVSSLGSWLAAMFSIWSVLPYAMVVPVYATAVVVIVLGVYKRFFM